MNLEKEINKTKKKVTLLSRNERGGITMLISGILLCSTGIVAIGVTQDYPFSISGAFIAGFLITEESTVGFMLIHKSLRGKWL